MAKEPTADERAGNEGRAMANVTGMPSPDGASKPGQPGFDIYGISGLTRYGPISRVYEEFLRELQGPSGMKSYREMSDNDPISGAILFAAQHLCRKVSFKFKPANNSNEAQKVADFVGSCIFDDMESSWPDTVSEILTMLPFGWALMEFTFKRRLGMGDPSMRPAEYGTISPNGVGVPAPDFVPSRFDDGKIGFRSWSLRSQETLFMWEFDDQSRAQVMQQMAPPDYRIRRIPLSKCLLFRTQVSKNNPEGRSVLRNAWTSYYFKKNIQVIEGIGVERELAGYPMIQIAQPNVQNGMVPPDIWNSQDPNMVALLSALKKIVRSVRRDEQEGLVMPWWAEFKLVSTGSRRTWNTTEIIGRYDQRIAMSMMADFIMLGHEAVGSKALAATKISLFTSALSSFLDNAGAIIDRQAVPILLQFNGIPMDLAPKLEHGEVESVNMQELGDYIAKLAGTGFNPLATFDAQKVAMESAHLPTTGMEYQDVDEMLQRQADRKGGSMFGGGVEGGNSSGEPKPKPKNRASKPGSTTSDKPGDNATGGGGEPVTAEQTTIGTPAALVTT